MLCVGEVLLRPLTRDDVGRYEAELVGLRNDFEAARLSLARPRRQDAGDIERWIDFRNNQDDCYLFGIFRYESFLGYAMIQVGPDDRASADLGVVLLAAQRGRGHGKAAVAALVDHCRGALGCRRLTARILEGNAASVRIFEANGFRQVDCREGLRTPDGGAVDLLIFELSGDGPGTGDARK